MKQSFPGHFLMTPEKIEEMWETATFVFDTNVILSIYKYSPESSKRLIEIFGELKNRIWIPHRVMTEVLENRFSVIGTQVKIYDDTLKTLVDFESKLGKEKLHPAISSDLREAIQSKLIKVKEELEIGSKRHNNLYREDSNIKIIFDLFDGKIGDDFDKNTLSSVIKEGEERYTDKIPPGYADEKTKANNASYSLYKKTNQYGDYIIWKQILNKFGDSKKSVIFITEDRKEDWWVLHPTYKKQVLFARPELVKEFYDNCGEGFLLSSLDNFIKKLSKNTEDSNNDDLIAETISIQESINLKDQNKINHLKQNNRNFTNHFSTPSEIEGNFIQHNHTLQIRKEIKLSKRLIEILESEIKNLERTAENIIDIITLVQGDEVDIYIDQVNKLQSEAYEKKGQVIELEGRIKYLEVLLSNSY